MIVVYENGEQNVKHLWYVRPQMERAMPEWERNALDERRRLDIQRRAENPAMYEQLDRIESKLDAILRELG